MSTFKDLISKIAVPSTDEENQPVSEEEIQDAVAEVNAKDEQIETLKMQLEEKSKAYEDLKNRVLENLFSNPKGKPEEPEEPSKEEPEEPKRKSFKDIINPQFEIKN